MEQQHEGVDAEPAQAGGNLVGGPGLIAERDRGDTGRVDDRGRRRVRDADKAHGNTPDPTNLGRWEYSGAGVSPGDVRREVREPGASEAVSVGAALGWVAPAAVQPQQLLDPLVELVVADGGEIQTEGVHDFDGGLVLEGGADQRARADEVPGRNREYGVGGLPGLPPQPLDPGGEVLGAAGRRAVDEAAAARRRVDRPVEVVERQQMGGRRATSVPGVPAAPVRGKAET